MNSPARNLEQDTVATREETLEKAIHTAVDHMRFLASAPNFHTLTKEQLHETLETIKITLSLASDQLEAVAKAGR